MRKRIIAALAALPVLAFTAGIAGTATAQAAPVHPVIISHVVKPPRDFTNMKLCNYATDEACVYENGTDGHGAFGKAPADGSQMELSGDPVCTHAGSPSVFVQAVAAGDATNCPFSTVADDTHFAGDEIVIFGLNSTGCTATTASPFNVVQDNNCNGHDEWIHDTTGAGNYNLVNVFYTDQTGDYGDLTAFPGSSGDQLYIEGNNGGQQASRWNSGT